MFKNRPQAIKLQAQAFLGLKSKLHFPRQGSPDASCVLCVVSVRSSFRCIVNLMLVHDSYIAECYALFYRFVHRVRFACSSHTHHHMNTSRLPE